jgi:Autographiviridae endonuclease VII
MEVSKKCRIIGCKSISKARGFCGTHYQQYWRNGEIEKMRSTERGAMEQHPLYSAWSGVRRYRRDDLCDEWKDDFWAFADAVKERPEGVLHPSIQPKDDAKPIGPDNWYWRIPSSTGTDYARDRREYMRRWVAKARRDDPYYFRIAAMRRYGVTREWYETTLEKQGHACAICGKQEDKEIGGKVLSLAVDHCHDTKRVRGLLCSNCNRGIGHLKHDIAILEAAIAYLRKTD